MTPVLQRLQAELAQREQEIATQKTILAQLEADVQDLREAVSIMQTSTKARGRP